MTLALSGWDVVLIVAVSLPVILAYLPRPQWKAFVLTLPIPFTIATLAVARPVDATNIVGLILLLVFTHSVRVLHVRGGWPIFPAIIAGMALYCAPAVCLASLLPKTEIAFWSVSATTLLIGISVLQLLPPRDEPNFRTPLPLVAKLPVIVAVVCGLVLLKSYLQGFMTVFPMVGVIGAYETRHSLWTMGRQIPIVMLTLTPMMIACYLTQDTFGLPVALAFGWIIFSLALLVVSNPIQVLRGEKAL